MTLLLGMEGIESDKSCLLLLRHVYEAYVFCLEALNDLASCDRWDRWVLLIGVTEYESEPATTATISH